MSLRTSARLNIQDIVPSSILSLIFWLDWQHIASSLKSHQSNTKLLKLTSCTHFNYRTQVSINKTDKIMATMHPYLNFDGKAEEAFNFYKSVFGGEFIFFAKMSDAPESDQLSEEERNRVMHVALPINEHTILMASIVCLL